MDSSHGLDNTNAQEQTKLLQPQPVQVKEVRFQDASVEEPYTSTSQSSLG